MSERSQPVTAVTLVRVPRSKRWWAFSKMRSSTTSLNEHRGLLFGKVMGSGSGVGFSARPNFRVWAMITVWEQSEAFASWHGGPWFAEYRRRAEETITILQHPIRARGTWGGVQPFPVVEDLVPGQLRAVITRGSIRRRRLWAFWRTVPSTSRATERAVGRLFSVGVGELPWVEQATWSLWEDEGAIRRFAYGSAAHRRAIQKTRTLNWYSEEMFVRFAPYALIGSWSSFPDLDQWGVTRFSDTPSPAELLQAQRG